MRSPLAERTAPDPFPKSPSFINNNGSFTPSSHALPPLKFHSGLLAVPPSLVVSSLENEDDDDDDGDDDDDDDESIASVSDSTYSYEDILMKPREHLYEEEELFGYRPSTYAKSGKVNVGLESRNGSLLNKGFMSESLRIEVPDHNFRRFTTDCELGVKKSTVLKTSTPGAGNHLQRQIHLRNFRVSVEVLKLLYIFKSLFLIAWLY